MPTQDDIDNLINLEENANRYGGMMQVKPVEGSDRILPAKPTVNDRAILERHKEAESQPQGNGQPQRSQRGVLQPDTAVAYLNQQRKADAHAPVSLPNGMRRSCADQPQRLVLGCQIRLYPSWFVAGGRICRQPRRLALAKRRQ